MKHGIWLAVLLTLLLLLTACTKDQTPAPANLGTVTARPGTAAAAPASAAAQTTDEKQVAPTPDSAADPADGEDAPAEDDPAEEASDPETGETGPETAETEGAEPEAPEPETAEAGETEPDAPENDTEEESPEEEPEVTPPTPVPEEVVFLNSTDNEIHGVHISPVSSDNWAERLNDERIPAGSSIRIPFGRFSDGGSEYDVGIINRDSINYDIYGVTLSFGDTLVLSGNDSAGRLTVRHADGSEDRYNAKVYSSAEEEEETPAAEVTFTNSVGSTLSGVYISSVSEEDWSDKLNSGSVRDGASIRIPFDSFSDGGSEYDVGFIDANGVNYDIFGVTLHAGDALALIGDSSAARLVIRGADGSERSYAADVY